jgi:hypothetical protein
MQEFEQEFTIEYHMLNLHTLINHAFAGSSPPAAQVDCAAASI